MPKGHPIWVRHVPWHEKPKYKPRTLKSGEVVCELVDDNTTASLYDCDTPDECCNSGCSHCR